MVENSNFLRGLLPRDCFEISPRIFQSHRNKSVSVLHMVGLKGRIFGCLALAHGLLEWPLSLQSYDSGALVLQHFVIIIVEWFARK